MTLSRRHFVVYAFCVLLSTSSALAFQRAKTALPDYDATGGLTIGKPAVAEVALTTGKARVASSRTPVRMTFNLSANSNAPRAIWSTEPLSAASSASPREAALEFLSGNRSVWNFATSDIQELEVSSEVKDQHTGVTHIYLSQKAGGVRVFPSMLAVHLNARQQVLAVDGDVFPQMRTRWSGSLSPADAARFAASYAGVEYTPRVKAVRENETELAAGNLRSDIRVTRTIYGLSQPPRSAYRMVIDKNGNEWYDIIVDATTGELLHRRNLYQFIGLLTPSAPNEAAPAAPRGLVHLEHPLSTTRGTNDGDRKYPFTVDPTGKQRGFANAPLYGASTTPVSGAGVNAVIAQSLMALPDLANPVRSSSMPLSTAPQSPKGWFTPIGGVYYTIGNNVDAKDDHNADNEATIGMRASGGSNGDFSGPSFVYKNFYAQNGPYPSEGTSLQPASAQRKAGGAPDLNPAILTLFFVSNWYHDLLYHLGFNEASGNFQNDNFGKGGLGGDYVFADAQDGSGTNNANFGTPPDGSNPRMQMFLFSSPERDGDFDGDVVIHEYTHGLSNRLVGGPNNTDCLGVGLVGESGSMGEGWGDWMAAMVYDEPVTGEYATGDGEVGIRRFAMSEGPADFTYGFLCTGPVSNPSQIPCEVHDGGEFWSIVLWEMRESMINRYHNRTSPVQFPTFTGTNAAGNIRYAQGRTTDGSGDPAKIDNAAIENGTFAAMFRVVDGMKYAPCNPTMADMRDAILTADRALGGEHQDLIWRAFANRGLGELASSTGGQTPVIVESFAVPATVAACEAAGGPLSAPLFTAVSTAPNSVTITITANGAAEYIIERGIAGAGSAIDPKPFLEIGRTTTGTFVDSNVDGGRSIYYRVRAARNDDCISAANVVSIVPLGTAAECTTAPQFTGLARALDAANCKNIALDWPSATSSCPSNSGITYSIYRDTNASFTPSSSNMIAKGVVGNSYIDTPAKSDTIYYYIVRAEDSTTGHGGPNNGGNVDTNTVRRSAMVTSPILMSEGFFDDVENGSGTSKSAHFTSSSPILLIPERGGWFRDADRSLVDARSGSYVWHTFNPDNQVVSASDSLVYELRSDTITITPSSVLSFFHTFQAEGAFDGGVVEWAPIDANGNTGSWRDLGSLIYENGYNGALTATSFGVLNSNPMANRPAYTGGTIGPMQRVRAHLGALVPTGASQSKIAIRFLFGNDVANSADASPAGDYLPGWYIDDISIDKSCCPSSAAPKKLRARNTKEKTIELNWQAPDRKVAVQKYLIYREEGSDVIPTVFDDKIGEVAGNVTTYTDSNVRFGGVYHYVVRAIPVSGCPSDASNVVSIASSAVCNEAPAFEGAQSVSSPANTTCTLVVTWNAATPVCPGATVRYNVYRSSDPAFVPSLNTLRASGLTTTSYTDSNGLLSGSTYYYIVRAEDSTSNGTGPANGGNEDTNLKRVSGKPTGPLAAAPDFNDDLEPTSEAGYESFNTRSTGGWTVMTDATARSQSHAWVALDEQPGAPTGTQKDATLTLPAMNVTASSVLTFWHNFDFARFVTGSPATNYQSGGVLEISSDGDTWLDLGKYITAGAYNGVVEGGTTSPAQSPLAGRSAWVGSSDGDLIAGRTDAMKMVSVNLGAAISELFGGATSLPNVRVRFRLGGTFQILIGGIQGSGWGIDDIKVTSLQAPGACSSSSTVAAP